MANGNLDMNQNAQGVLGQLLKMNYEKMKAEEANKVMRKYLKTSAEQLVQDPEGQKALLSTILKGKAIEDIEQQNTQSQPQQAQQQTQQPNVQPNVQPNIQQSVQPSVQQPAEQQPQPDQFSQLQQRAMDLVKPPTSMLGKLLEASGLFGHETKKKQLANIKSAQEILKRENQITPESQVAIIKKTQSLLAESGIDATVNATATGTPSIITQPEIPGLSDLTPDEQVQAIQLGKEIGTGRGMRYAIPSIVKRIKQNMSIDEIRDELRFSQQSPEFSGVTRNTLQHLTIGLSKDKIQSIFDSADDYLKNKDNEGLKEYIKGVAREKADSTTRQSIMGQERTIDFLGEIKNDLQTLENEGFNTTGFFTGKTDQLLAKVGQIKSPVHMELATRISLAVIQFRRAMTGVQFGMKEHAEYQGLFPGIDKIYGLNMATLDGLLKSFSGNTKKFYQQSMGEKNYNKMYGIKKDVPHSEIKKGYKENGYIFKGGDPSDKNNWEKE